MVSLLCTVDVEEDMPHWRVEASTSLRNLQGLHRFNALCDRLGVRPTYLCTYPVATRPEGDFLIDLQRRGRCEIGAHLHPWTTPPFDTNENRLEAIQPSRLPPSAMEAKLRVLTTALAERFGQAPTSYRAGRFGFNGAGLQALERLGYLVDSSVTPLCDWTSEGGVDARMAPDVPYFPDRQRVFERGSSPVLEVPLSIGFSSRLPEQVSRGLVALPSRLRVRGILSKLAGLELRWLYPSAHSADAMCGLADVLVGRGVPVLNVFLHSSELWPGESPSNATTADVDRYLDTLERFFVYAIATLGAAPRTLTEFSRAWLDS